MTKEELAIKVINLRRALATANRMMAKDGANLLVGVQEDAGPSFRGGRKFWAEVRQLAYGRTVRGEKAMKIKFEGHSDDTFGAYWKGGDVDHDDCANGTVRTIVVKAGDQRMAVTGVYGQGCMWSVGIAPIEDDEPMPDWPMTWSFSGYSTVLEVEVPDGFEVTLVQPLPEKDED